MVGNIDVNMRIVGLLRFWSPMLMVRGIMVPTVRRIPYPVVCTPLGVDNGTADKGRLNNVIVAIEIRIADNLGIIVILNHYRRHVLSGIKSIHVLYDDKVCTAVNLLDHAEVIHIAVPIEVQIADLARVVVQVSFELLHSTCLCKSDGDCLKIEIITQVGRGVDIDGFRLLNHRIGCRDCRRRLLDHNSGRLLGNNRRCNDTSR